MTTHTDRPAQRREPEENRASPAPIQSDTSGVRAREDDVAQLAGALRAADRAYRAYLAELRQGDVEPVGEWSTMYAEYLLGLR